MPFAVRAANPMEQNRAAISPRSSAAAAERSAGLAGLSCSDNCHWRIVICSLEERDLVSRVNDAKRCGFGC